MTIPAAIGVREIFELLRDDLVAIELEFGRDTVSSVGVITEIGEYLRGSGGKRLRPALLLLAAKMMGHNGSSGIRLGAVVEIIHTATLVHDDIIDEAQTRRGRAAANVRWGNSKCVLAGDWLYMQAFKLAVQERNFRILDVLIELTQMMVEGELIQMEKLGRRINEREHLDLIERKTACLFSVCTRLGAILGEASPEQEEKLSAYGRNLGMAFQLVDDLLDLTASEETLGKPVGSDLREGKVTMAVIHALERCTPEEAAAVDAVLRERAFESVTHEQILGILQRYGSVDAAMERASQYAAKARESICSFPDSEFKRALLWAPEFVVAREK
ncbi:MAG: polyprenyl synthetase family protein [Candidatus Korobacteraceae bacterium]